jgi:hypothetical protein
MECCEAEFFEALAVCEDGLEFEKALRGESFTQDFGPGVFER